MTRNLSVLIVDDEVQLCQLIARKLKKANILSYVAHHGAEAISLAATYKVDAIILDYMLPDMTGVDVLREIKVIAPDTPVIMLTAYGNVESAVSAMKLGAVDYLNKPMELEELKQIILKNCEQRHTEARQDEKTSRETFAFKSNKMKNIMGLIRQVKETDASILILGESGVGKTAFARWIHEHSNRKKAPFLSINCASVPESVMETELFGDYRDGRQANPGKFVAADGGTIFLDEIGEMSSSMQAKLLHVMEDKMVKPLGSNDYQAVDIRIITATNKNMKELVSGSKFREDLYYRLNLIEIEIPPLRDRKEDIPVFIKHHIVQLNEKYNKHIQMDPQSIDFLQRYHYPGNIRELLNTLERIHILKRFGTIVPEDMVHASFQLEFSQQAEHGPTINHFSSGNLPEVLEEVEEKMIKQALEDMNGNQTKAAEKLGIARHTLIYKIKKFGLKY